MKKHTDDELLPPTPDQIRYLRVGEDPYAKLSVTLREPEPASATRQSATASSAIEAVSQKQFETVARRILGFYVPEAQRNRLPAAYRNFIERNKARSPRARYKILEKLSRYDLSDIPGINPRFNREREELTEAKLREIEQSVTDDE